MSGLVDLQSPVQFIICAPQETAHRLYQKMVQIICRFYSFALPRQRFCHSAEHYPTQFLCQLLFSKCMLSATKFWVQRDWDVILVVAALVEVFPQIICSLPHILCGFLCQSTTFFKLVYATLFHLSALSARPRVASAFQRVLITNFSVMHPMENFQRCSQLQVSNLGRSYSNSERSVLRPMMWTFQPSVLGKCIVYAHNFH